MGITQLSVKRPAAVWVLLILCLGAGIMSYFSLGADLYPAIDAPAVTITTTYPGADAEEIKKDIVKPIEDSVSGISGIDTIKSTAKEGVGYTVIMFSMETNMNSAFIDVQKAVDSAAGELPGETNTPILTKIDMNAQAVMNLAVTGTVSYDQLYNEADKIKQNLEKLPGIGQVSLEGAKEKQISILLDKMTLESYGIDVSTILARLKTENINIPAGRIEQKDNSRMVKMSAEFDSIGDIKSLMIPTLDGGSIRLEDIADIQFQYPEDDQVITLNGKNAIGISIQKQSDANVVEVVDNVKKELKGILNRLPSTVTVTTTNDSTIFINNSLKDVQKSLIEGIITTTIVLFLFLRSWQSSLVVLVAIPTSLITTFFFMKEFGFTLNMMTLMALSLSIGILVDDSIVVIENIQKHLKKGKDPIQAAIDGRKEISMAAIAITLCDVVVFVPVAFMSGIVGRFFREFGLTVAAATLISLLVSFTVTPMLSSRFLKKENMSKEAPEGPDDNPINRKSRAGIFIYVTALYKKVLLWSMNNRRKVLITIIIACIMSAALLPLGFIKTEFMPQGDQSQLTIGLNLTPDSTLKQTEAKTVLIENYLKTIDGVKDYMTTVGTGSDKSSSNIIVNLVDTNYREKSQAEIASDIRQWGKTLTGCQLTVTEAQSVLSGNNSPVQVMIKGPDHTVLKKLAFEAEDIIKSVPGTTDVKNSERITESQLVVEVDRPAAAQYGVNTSDIASVLRTGLQGSDAGTFTENENDYDIVVQFMKGQISTVEDIGEIKIKNSQGQLISLNQMVDIKHADNPNTISREDREDTVKISANIQQRTLGEINKDIQNKLDSLDMPSGYSIKFGGSQKNMAESFTSLTQALAISIVLVYAILIILYESFMTPLLRLMSLPCAIIGAFGLLALSRNTLNIVSMIGLIMLDGLASKNGTLLIDYAQTLMKRGIPLKEALIEAGTTRLKPILMTSATMIIGMIPTAIASGEGSEIRRGMAIVVIGGMITSTILSPIIIPVVYTLFDDIKKRFSRKSTKNLKTVEV